MKREMVSAILVTGVSLIFAGCSGGSSDSSSGSDSSTSNTSSSNDVQYNMCTKISSTQAEVVCTVYDCDSDFDLEGSYNIKSNCEVAAQYWLDNVSNSASGTDASSDTGSSDDSSSSSSGNEDVYVEKASCFQVVSEEWDTACNNSLAVKWRNTCSETLDLKYYIERTNGTWSSGIQNNISSGETSSGGAWACEATGNYGWRGRSSDSSASFPVDY